MRHATSLEDRKFDLCYVGIILFDSSRHAGTKVVTNVLHNVYHDEGNNV